MKLILGTVLCCGLGLSEASPRRPSPAFDWDDVNFLLVILLSYIHIINTARLAFGDSYTYVQGTAGRQNYSFIGDVQNFAFTPETLLSNKIVQNQVSVIPKSTQGKTDMGVDRYISWRTKLGRISHRVLLWLAFEMQDAALGLRIRRS
jgi:hypothetical protein